MNIVLENRHLKIAVKTKGAELCSVVSKDTKLEYMWSGDPAIWGKTSPVLFPIVGTLKEDTFIYQDKKYPMSRHGFARDLDFEVVEEDENHVVLVLRSSVSTVEKYPFNFELRLIYELVQNYLHVTYQVKNSGKDEMYFSIGGHPAFAAPVVKGSRYEDHYLEFNKIETAGRWPISKEGLIELHPVDLLINTNKIRLTRSLFESDALVFKHLQSDKVSLKSETHDHGLDFYFEGFPFLGIWAAKNADFVCIEPWCGIADSTNHEQQLTLKEGVENVQPLDSWSRSWKVKFY